MAAHEELEVLLLLTSHQLGDSESGIIPTWKPFMMEPWCGQRLWGWQGSGTSGDPRKRLEPAPIHHHRSFAIPFFSVLPVISRIDRLAFHSPHQFGVDLG